MEYLVLDPPNDLLLRASREAGPAQGDGLGSPNSSIFAVATSV